MNSAVHNIHESANVHGKYVGGAPAEIEFAALASKSDIWRQQI